MPSAVSWSVGLLLGWAAIGCTPGGVGDPCTPEDEYQQEFNGFQVTETNVESRSFQCETRLCLVNHFQGRVSCRMGQTAAQGAPYLEDKSPNPDWKPVCSVPGTAVDRRPDNDGTLRRDPARMNTVGGAMLVDTTTGEPGGRDSRDNINVEVPAQLTQRQTEQAVYCSCRCDGPDAKARYCECPEGFQCEKLVDKLAVGGAEAGGQLAGSYCIRSGSQYKPQTHFKGAESCSASPNKCDCDPTAEDYPAECGSK